MLTIPLEELHHGVVEIEIITDDDANMHDSSERNVE